MRNIILCTSPELYTRYKHEYICVRFTYSYITGTATHFGTLIQISNTNLYSFLIKYNIRATYRGVISFKPLWFIHLCASQEPRLVICIQKRRDDPTRCAKLVTVRTRETDELLLLSSANEGWAGLWTVFAWERRIRHKSSTLIVIQCSQYMGTGAKWGASTVCLMFYLTKPNSLTIKSVQFFFCVWLIESKRTNE